MKQSSTNNLYLSNVILNNVKMKLTKKKSLQTRNFKKEDKNDDFEKLIDNLENPSFLINDKNNQTSESNIREKFKLSFQSISKKEPNFEDIDIEKFSKISGHSENANSMISLMKHLKKDDCSNSDRGFHYKSESNFDKNKIQSKKSIFNNLADNNISKNHSFFDHMDDYDVINNNSIKKSELIIDLNKEMDPDSPELLIIEKEFFLKLETLSNIEKFNTKMIYDCLDFDSRIDYMKKFIVNQREKINKNKVFENKEISNNKVIEINKNIRNKNDEVNSLMNVLININHQKNEIKNSEKNKKEGNLNKTKIQIEVKDKEDAIKTLKNQKKSKNKIKNLFEKKKNNIKKIKKITKKQKIK